ncbi:penicillin acylase family protein [Candidatus Zixiibacteriota bacterium]
MKKILKWLGIIVAVIVIGLVIGGYLFLRSSLPDYNGKITITGVTAEVEIYRDSYGMPHIYAANDADAYFALGYAMAQDRLFQMDMVRRTVHGRMAEVLGVALVEADMLFRILTAAKSPAEMVDELPDSVQAALAAFAAGVNGYLERRSGALPLEFLLAGYEPEPWQPDDCAAVLYYMAWMLNFSFDTEMLHAAIIDHVGAEAAARLFVDYPDGYPTIIPPDLDTNAGNNLGLLCSLNLVRELAGGGGRGASNSWVIDGMKSTTGRPLLANDMHLGLGLPGIWYEAHLVTPEMNVSGVLAPGVPLVVVGANEHVAWGFTNVMADDADYYREKLHPDDSTLYEYQGAWHRMTVVDKAIKVRGGDDLPFAVRLTHHGPVISDINGFDESPGEALTMRWVIYDLHQTATALFHLNRARHVADIEDAVRSFKCPGQNWVYADDQGNIGYWAAVGIPRREGFTGAMPLPGWDGEHEWDGYVATENQPRLKNPSRGWIASANNRQAVDYPYPISHYYAMPDRITRIERMLQEKDKLGIDDFKRMHADVYMILAEEWVPLMIAALSGETLNEKQEMARDILGRWDFVASTEATAPSIFHTTVGFMMEKTFRPRLGDSLYDQYKRSVWRAHNALRELITKQDTLWFDDPATAKKETLTDLINESFTRAVDYLIERIGDDPAQWQWGKLHTLTFHHPLGQVSPLFGYFLNVGPFPFGGGVSTVNPGPYGLTHRWGVFAGASMRYIIDLGDMKNSLRVIPTGISGNFLSPHYDDQAELWCNVEYRPFLLLRNEVKNDAAHVLRLSPR